MRRKKSKGFTLLEVVAATVIVSMGLVPIMKVLPAALQVSSKIEVITKCTFLAEKEMERVRAELMADYSNDPTSDPEQSLPTAADDRDLKYYYEISLPDPPWDDSDEAVNEIKVIVWFDKDNSESMDGDENRVILATKVANRG